MKTRVVGYFGGEWKHPVWMYRVDVEADDGSGGKWWWQKHAGMSLEGAGRLARHLSTFPTPPDGIVDVSEFETVLVFQDGKP